MKRTLLLLSLLVPVLLSAQDQMLTIEDAILRRGKLGPEMLSGLDWIPGTHTYYHYAQKDGKPCLVFQDIKGKTNDTLSIEKLNLALTVFNNTINALSDPIPAFQGIPMIVSWKDKERFRFKHNGKILLYHINKNYLASENDISMNAENTDIHPESGNLAYTENHNLFVKPVNEPLVQVNNNTGITGLVFGESVHRNEFGIHKGTFWAPSGKKLAFYQMDENMVTEYPIYRLDDMPATGQNIRYPFAGSKSHHVTVGIYNLKTGKSLLLKTGEPAEQYLTNVAWGPDEKFIYIAVVSRAQDNMWLRKYNAETGDLVKTLFTEKNEKYVEPENPPVFVKGNDKQFIWQSERDGFNHLYLYNEDGSLERQLTSGKWVVTEFLGFDKKGKNAFFMANKENPLNNNLYSVELKTGKITGIATEDGYHYCKGTEDGEYWTDFYSSHKTPGITQIKNNSGKREKLLLESKNRMSNYRLGETSVFTIKSTDGITDLYCRMVKPINFDPSKKYPVVVYLYGGPHLQMIRNTFLYGSDLWMQYMAQQGYVVFSLDNRGSANRGFEFESAVFRNLGTLEMEDQLAGVNYLKSQSFVDGDRMAVFGWSFGGFMSTSLMTRHPGTFKVGVAGGPVIDWAMYEIMYTERYMDTPEENPEGYKTANLLNYVDQLEGKLLLIHGTSDDVVLWQHSLLYLKKTIEKDVMIDYFVYPGHKHNVYGKDRVHLYKKVTNFIVENLEE